MVDPTKKFLADRHKKVVILCVSIAWTKQKQLFLFLLLLCGSNSTSWELKKKQCHRLIQKGEEKSLWWLCCGWNLLWRQTSEKKQRSNDKRGIVNCKKSCGKANEAICLKSQTQPNRSVFLGRWSHWNW